MAAEVDEELFKTTLMGGFDKDDVLAKFRDTKEEAEAAQMKLQEQIRERDKMISELRQSLKNKEAENEQLQKDIKEKYQSYIDNYDSIGKLVFEAKVRSENMETETRKKCDEMLRKTKEDCTRLVQEARRKEEEVVAVYEEKIERQAAEAQKYMEEQMTKSRENYRIVRKEMDDMVRAMDDLQKAFLESYRKVHAVKETMGTSAQNLEPFFRQLQSEKAKAAKDSGKKQDVPAGEKKASGTEEDADQMRQKVKNTQEPEEGFLDDGMDFDEELENQIHSLLKDDDESEEGGQG